MAKFYGPIGYAETVETTPGVYVDRIIERNYYGEMLRNTFRLESSGGVNDNINLSNEISIVSDPYAYEHFHMMRYVEFMGTRWKVNSVDPSKYPRLVLTTGGVYNGE